VLIHDDVEFAQFDAVKPGELFLADIVGTTQHCIAGFNEHDRLVVMVQPSNNDYEGKPGIIASTFIEGPILKLKNSKIVPAVNAKAIRFKRDTVAPGAVILTKDANFLCILDGSTEGARLFLNLKTGAIVQTLGNKSVIAFNEWTIEIERRPYPAAILVHMPPLPR
jgi:hypothetical protein